MKITEEEYLKAINIVKSYEEQLEKGRNEIKRQIEKEQLIKEKNCKEHYFISSGGKWSSQGEMTCIHCNKVINK